MTLDRALRPARFSSHRCMRSLALQLAAALSTGAAGANAANPLPPWTFTPESAGIGNCNDAGPGSLRDAILSASPGQVIDLTQLPDDKAPGRIAAAGFFDEEWKWQENRD